jgi:hypothetical protein
VGDRSERRRLRKQERRRRLLEAGPVEIEPLTDDEMQQIEDDERNS